MILLMIFDNGISAEGDLTNEDEERWSRDEHWESWTGQTDHFEYMVIVRIRPWS